MKNTAIVVLLLTASLIFLTFGCLDVGENTQVPGLPFTVGQLVNKIYLEDGSKANYTDFVGGVYDGNFFGVLDGNIVLVDVNSGGVTPGTGVDTNTQTAGWTDSNAGWYVDTFGINSLWVVDNYDGEYTYFGVLNGKPAYSNPNGWYVHFDAVSNDWVLSDSPNDDRAGVFHSPSMIGTYDTGIATARVFGSWALYKNGDIQTAGTINDKTNAVSINPNNRILYASDGSTPALDWANGGRVLINGATDNAEHALQVYGAGTAGTQLLVQGSVDSAGVKLIPDGGDAREFQATASDDGTIANAWLFYNRTDGTYDMTITDSGNILIGTTTDDGVSKLQVNGNIMQVGGQTIVVDPNYLRFTGRGFQWDAYPEVIVDYNPVNPPSGLPELSFNVPATDWIIFQGYGGINNAQTEFRSDYTKFYGPGEFTGRFISTSNSVGAGQTNGSVELGYDSTGDGGNGWGFVESIDRLGGNLYKAFHFASSKFGWYDPSYSGYRMNLDSTTASFDFPTIKLNQLTTDGCLQTTNSDGTVSVGTCGGVDTNWETSWPIFDANMKATYLQLPSSSALSLPTLASGQYLTNNGTTLNWSAISSSVDTNMYTAGIMRADNNALLIDLNGGGKSLFGFLDGNFTRNVFIDGNLILNGVIKHSTCPSGYVLVPGDSNFGTNDFCVMKYEAQKSAIMQAVSIQGGTPWTDVSWYDAREACKRAGAHLITNAEWMTIARNISNQATNWQSGTVGSGCLYGGHMDNLPANKLATSDDGTPYSGTLDASTDAVKCPFVVNVAGAKASRRTMNLSNGSVVWDISGNVWEWVDEQCANGSGMSSTYWYNSGAWVEWSNANLSDYELYVAGPTGGYTSANGTGQYYGCTTNGNGLLRGANWDSGVFAGAFAMHFNAATSASYPSVGFRCVR